MSLQVWLPLTNGTLKQQGLKNISATIGGTVGLTDAGKLGKCATIGTAAGGITLPASAMTSFTECSVAFWINITSWNTNWDTIFQAGLGSTPWNNYIFGILRNQGNYLCFTVSNGSSTSSGGYASSNLTVGQWMHLAFTYGSGKCKIYINGALDKEYSTSITPNFASITHIAIGRSTNGSNYQCKCKLNDFRIYDHCLSPMEVKELAKGLVLHYPLNRNGWGQENLLARYVVPGQAAPTSTAAGGRTTWLGDYKITIPATENADTYFRLFTTKQLTANATYTISCQVSGLKEGSYYRFPLYAQNNTGMGVLQLDHNGLCSLTFTMTYGTQTAATGANGETIYICFMDDSARLIASGQGAITVSDFKLEEGSIATPWCPNSSDALATTMGLNSTTEYDCSGYCNNGTRTGTFTWTSNTPKYQVSTKIAAASTGIKTSNFYVGDIWSMSVWFKYPSQDSSGWKALVILNNNGGDADLQFGNYINCSSNIIQYSANGKYTTGVTFTYGEWHHIVNTYDGTTLKCYLDGVYKTSVTPGQTLSRSNLGIGFKSSAVDFSSVSSSFTNGFLSDVRVYATALSASDVKSLYQNSAYIDSSGNVYGAVHSEV